MNDLIKTLSDKVSSYNFFNFIFPGALFLGLIKFLGNKDIAVDQNIWWFLLASYACGLIISRIGSLCIEEIFKCCGWITKYDIHKYSKSRKENNLTAILLEVCNTYRTLCAMWLVLLIITILDDSCNNKCVYILLEISLIILFAFSFIKQYNYFKNNIE